MKPPVALTIAGTDPSGGAGTSADLKTFGALGAFGTSVITAVVAQNTQGVAGFEQLAPDFVRLQLENLLADVRVDALKIGMLGDAATIRVVAEVLRGRPARYVVLDPVMVAKSGHRLLAPEAVAALRDELLPLVDLVTPNLPEAADLLGQKEVDDEAGMAAQLASLAHLAPGVLLKGGHADGEESVDLLAIDGATHRLTAPRVTTKNTHGTGCTLSAAIAALRPQRADWVAAVTDAKAYLSEALRRADELEIGHGHGPVHHYHAWW
ncbi:bifunctional hydroxymethylpyrimidine kinase/phosphomethylpyrimidine kinase [Calidifontibacter sp. DB0510]|uniref:Bifunctional hydroxymethylpyrimidine kinase/phosphomethylpyrimidine kinase n=1 Tax=Metallococcus carri TaxID=1656884 RepID=A0A967B2Y1_9MICO|nr:bifunctional hydroxymethylpyrimidine kinase/phosphomethylpyrimidine kinase [Metallococcus carri]NHN57353.1 bifunctional hydroxymethylpyrimidine kinase/phosphomethylpyrimidine kinase [Metallococcus carri]NOP39131.1 bifunctional hydroxymethylpyrimidine kinase/phosphomethylpyrimidine kinase [Calidifontibacter sp. DB2511S]